jgi:hypothetical protein
MMRAITTLLLAVCTVLPTGQAGAQAPAPAGAAVRADHHGSYWFRYDTMEYYGGAWHPAGSFQNPSYELVANSRRVWLAGGPHHWASSIYTIYVP